MLYPTQVRQRARDLRREGKTYREICSVLSLDIPKGTLSGWLKDVPLDEAYYSRVKALWNENIIKAQKLNKEMLAARLSNLRIKNISLVNSIDKNIGKLILAMLYWCEGNKYPSHRCLMFGNSDPKMIKLFITLLRLCYPIDESKFRLTVHCRADQNSLSLRKYWSEITGITWTQHYKTLIDKRTFNKPTQKLNYHGVCVINYFNTDLQCELQFFGEYLGTNSAIEQMKIQIK